MSTVQIEHDAAPHVSVITMNRPERLNAMSVELVSDLCAAFEEVGRNNQCWVVVLTGAGRGFCSGLDLEDYGVIPNIAGLPISRISMRAIAHFSQVVPKMRAMPQPIIAAVNGPAYGGGMCLSLGAEIRIAAQSAVFNSTGIVNGLTSTELGASYLLPRLIGAAHSNDILLTGKEVSAQEALRIGLISRVVPDGKALETALHIATDMCRFSPHGLAMTKEVIWANLEIPSLQAAIDIENRNQILLGATRNLEECIRARKTKRNPVYDDQPRNFGEIPEN